VINFLSKFFSIDKTVFLGLSERVWTIFGSSITIICIVKFLSPEDQGYYYTILSLLELRIFVELGLTFVIMQLASHESHGIFWDRKNAILGNKESISNIASIFSFFTKWFLIGSLLLSILMIVLGLYFFTINGDILAVKNVWTVAVFFNFFQLITIPFMSILEGVKKINTIYKLRLCKAFFNHVVLWICLYNNLGIYSLLFGQMIIFLIQSIFLFRYRNAIFILTSDHSKSTINWKKDILPFQWKTSLSFLCGYLLVQVFAPIALHFRGPELAGRVGLSIRLIRIIADTSLVWIRSKAPLFGQLISQKNYKKLESIFWKNLRSSLIFTIIGYIFLNVLVLYLNYYNYEIINRLMHPKSILYLSISFSLNAIIIGCSYYLRAHKTEPFLLPTIVGSLFSLIIALISFSYFDEIVFSIFLLINTIFSSLLWCGYIFIKDRRKILSQNFKNEI
jgi:hypothetical protein